MRPAGIVLAGGASRRFGSDKLAARLEDGRSILAHAVDALAAVADPIVVVVAPGAAVPDVGRTVLVAHDAAAFGGPLAGLAAGLDALFEASVPADASAVAGASAHGRLPDVTLVVGGDMPWLEARVLDLLADGVARIEGARALVLEHEPTAVMPMAVRTVDARAAAHDLLAFDHRRLRALLEALRAGVVPIPIWRPLDPDGRTLRDIDTPADLG